MKEYFDLPYTTDMTSFAGTYRLTVGPVFLIGSGSRLGERRSMHLWYLKSGSHRNPTLQAAFNEGHPVEFRVLHICVPQEDSPDTTGRARSMELEQELLNAHFGTPGCCNTSPSAYRQRDFGAWVKRNWKDPTFRVEQLRKMKEGRVPISAESRKKMSLAKMGERHPAARSCTLTMDGEEFTTFSTVKAAAAEIGVAPKILIRWLKGKSPWPEKGRSQNYEHLAGLTGYYNDFLA